MGLPTITVPQYHLTVPSTGKEIKFRPFLVKEEKILLLAMEGEDQKQIVSATKEIVQIAHENSKSSLKYANESVIHDMLSENPMILEYLGEPFISNEALVRIA